MKWFVSHILLLVLSLGLSLSGYLASRDFRGAFAPVQEAYEETISFSSLPPLACPNGSIRQPLPQLDCPSHWQGGPYKVAALVSKSDSPSVGHLTEARILGSCWLYRSQCIANMIFPTHFFW
jgi:hypothetical protein